MPYLLASTMDKIQAKIEQLELARRSWNMSRESIELIANLIKRLNKPKVLEIGTNNGYSALWLSKYAEKVVTIEINNGFYEEAKSNLKGFENISAIHGDALEIIPKLDEKFDIVLIDAMKSQYRAYLEKSLRILDKNAIIFADNTISHKDRLGDFFFYLKSSGLFWKELGLGSGLVVVLI